MPRRPLTPSSRIYSTLRSIALWVGIALVAALLGLCLVRRWVPLEVLESSSDAVGNYLQTLGTIYAVLLAFVVYVVWQQFNDARAHVEQEANDLLDLIRTVRGLPEAVWRPFLARVERYVQLVLTDEWQAMASCSAAPMEGGGQVLEQMWDILVLHEPSSECHKSLYDEALVRFNDLSDARMKRLVSSRLRIPLALRLLLYTGAVMTVGSMWLFAVPSFVVHAIMTCALAGSISHVLYVISDLDDCFNGNWQVPRAQFVRVASQLGDARLLGSSAQAE